MRYLIGILFAAVVATTSLPAKAFFEPDFDRWFLEARGGLGLPPSPKTDFGANGGEYEAGDGYTIAFAVGAHIAENIRTELEFGVTMGEDGNFFIGATPIPHTGEAHVYSGMWNIMFELQIPNEHWIPYWGFGLGFAHFDIDNLGGGGFQIDDTDTTFNASFIAGLDIPVNNWLTLTSRLTTGITTMAEFDTTNPAIEVEKETQFYVFFTAGLRFYLAPMFSGLQ